VIGGTWHEGNRRGFPISDSPSNCHGYALHNSLKVRVCGPSTPTSKWAGFSAALPIAMARWWYKRKTGNRNHRMHRRWTETPPLWSAGKSPEGCVWAVVCPSEKEKNGDAILAEGSGSGRPLLWLSLWAYVWVWVWGTPYIAGGMGMQVWGVDNSTNYTHTTNGFCDG